MKIKFFKLMLYCAVAMLSFCVSATAIGMLIDRYHLNANNMLQKKINYLQQSEEKFNIIFAGSSYIYYGIKPKLLTEYLNAHGLQYNAYSLSEPGNYAFETHHYLNILKEFPPHKRPDYLIIDLVPITRDKVINVMDENKFNSRMIQYHDFNTTFLNIKAILYTNKTPRDKYHAVSDHVTHFLYNAANIGMGKYLAKYEYGLSGYDKVIIADNCGYDPKFKGKRAHKDWFTFKVFSDGIKRYKKIYYQTIENRKDSRFKDADQKYRTWQVMALKKDADLQFRTYQARALKKSNIEVLFVIPPVLYDNGQAEMRALCETENFPHCFFMDDLYQYPQLFEYENRYDLSHLNDAGAEYYTKFLAQSIIEYIESRQ